MRNPLLAFQSSGVVLAASSNYLDQQRSGVGTQVTNDTRLFALVCETLREHDTSKDRAPGQHFVALSHYAVECVSGGVGRRTTDPKDYVPRLHRGRVELFLDRAKAEPVTGVAAIVYTFDAYRKDPDVTVEELQRIAFYVPTHVLVGVLAFAGPPSQLTPYRFAANLAGGNAAFTTWTGDEIRGLAKGVVAYDDAWCVVADR